MLVFYLLVQGHCSGFAINYFPDREKKPYHLLLILFIHLKARSS